MPSNEAHSEKEKIGQLENNRQFLPVIVEKDGTALPGQSRLFPFLFDFLTQPVALARPVPFPQPLQKLLLLLAVKYFPIALKMFLHPFFQLIKMSGRLLQIIHAQIRMEHRPVNISVEAGYCFLLLDLFS